jgi:hypothetical protein
MEYGETGAKHATKMQLFLSEITLDNFVVYAETAHSQICYIKLNSINLMFADDAAFCDEIKQWFNAIINRSVLISGFSKKQFILYFMAINHKIERLKKELLEAEQQTM